MRPLSNFLPSKSSSRHAFRGSHLRLLSRRVFAKSSLRPSSVFFFSLFFYWRERIVEWTGEKCLLPSFARNRRLGSTRLCKTIIVECGQLFRDARWRHAINACANSCGLLRTCVAITWLHETAHPSLPSNEPFFFLSFSPSFSRCSSFRLVPFRLISSRLPYRWNTTGQLIRETRGVSRIASVFRLRNASRDTPRPWEFYTCRNYTGCELVRCKQTTSVRLSRQPRRHRSFSATIHVDTTPR